MTSVTNLSATSLPNQSYDQKLIETAEAFEAIFLRDMIKSMRSNALGSDLLGNSGQNQFRDMMDSEVASNMAANGKGFGIAKMLIAEWKQNDE